MTSFYVDNPIQLLEQSGLVGLVVDDNAAASPNVLWTSEKISSVAPPLPAFAKYSAPIQNITTSPSTILFSTLVGSSSLTSPTGQISISSGVVTLTSLTSAPTSWQINFDPNIIESVTNTVMTFQYQNPSGTNAGNTSVLSNTVTTPNNTGSNGIISEFITVPASSNTTFLINATSTTNAQLGASFAIPFVSIRQII